MPDKDLPSPDRHHGFRNGANKNDVQPDNLLAWDNPSPNDTPLNSR